MLTIVGGLISLVWWEGKRDERLDNVSGAVSIMQVSVGTLQTDFAVVKQQIADIHEAVKR